MRKFIRFLITGGSAAVVEYVVFLGLHYITDGRLLVMCQSISFMCGFIVSFTLNRRWVFKSDGNPKKELIKYTSLAFINLVLSNLILLFLVNDVKIVSYIAKVLVMGLIAIWNYIIYQNFIFVDKKLIKNNDKNDITSA